MSNRRLESGDSLIEHEVSKELSEESVTTKMATPLSSDSRLTDVQLESCKRATEALEERGCKEECHEGLKIRVNMV